MHSIQIGQFDPKVKILSKVDPRCKLICTLLAMVSVFIIENVYVSLVFFAGLILSMIICSVDILKFIKSLKSFIFVSLFIFAFQLLFNKEGSLLLSQSFTLNVISLISIIFMFVLYLLTYKFNKIKLISFLVIIFVSFVLMYYVNTSKEIKSFSIDIYKNGLFSGILILIRLFSVIIITTLFTSSTKLTDLTYSFTWALTPLKVIKINPEEIGLMISITLRYIPLLFDETQRIILSQEARGASFSSGSLSSRIKTLVSLLIPIFVISFERSESLSNAMIIRGYEPGAKRTRYRVLSWSSFDTFTLVLSIIVLGGAICATVLI